MLHKLIYKLGLYFRNNKINKNTAFLLKSQHWTLEELEAYQFKRLSALLTIAYDNSEYYREALIKSNITPSDIQNLTDIDKLPVLTKPTLLANNSRIQLEVKGEKSFHSETSGSTGEPLVFYRNQDWDAWHNASVFRGYKSHNINPWDRNGYLWGYNYSFKKAIVTKFFDFLQNRFRLFSYSDVEIEKFCKKLSKAKYLNGYSSMIYELAKLVEQRPALKDKINLSLIKGTSEKIFDSYQTASINAFGKKIISEYGAAEAGIIAFECPEGHMHVNMETVIVEEVNSKIVVTNLISNSFPIIRYELGDYIVLDKDTRCKCGRNSHIIKEVTGRVGKSIYGKKEIYPSLTLYYIFKNLATNHNLTLNYQVVQKTKGEINIRLENEINDHERTLLAAEVKKYFNDDMIYLVTENQVLTSKSGKTKDFITTIV